MKIRFSQVIEILLLQWNVLKWNAKKKKENSTKKVLCSTKGEVIDSIFWALIT
jgi:hypothetical protein